MELFTGTSGFAYKEWQGSFYPEKIKNDDMLPFYAQHFRACEINNSFYRIPAERTLLQWRAQVPAHFEFILKAPQKITHFTRLKEASRDTLEYFLQVARTLGEMGFGVGDSATNFVFARSPLPGRELFKALLRLGVIIRPLDEYGLPHSVRISIGTAAQNKALFNALRRVLAKVAA